MSKTIKISDGDIFIDDNGQSVLVEGNRKAGQDVASSLLLEYNSETGFGSELAVFVESPFAFINDGVIQQLVLEAIQRLQAKQGEDGASTADERVSRIKNLRIDRNNNGDVFFYLELETETGTTVDRAFLLPTSLDHLINSEIL